MMLSPALASFCDREKTNGLLSCFSMIAAKIKGPSWKQMIPTIQGAAVSSSWLGREFFQWDFVVSSTDKCSGTVSL